MNIRKNLENTIVKIAVAIAIIACVFGCIRDVSTICERFIDNHKKINTIGIVTGIYYGSERRGKGHGFEILNVSYEVNGEKYNSRFQGIGVTFDKGEEIDIYYYQDNVSKIGNTKADVTNTFCNIINLLFEIFVIIICFFGYKNTKFKR